jgi:hypothetical protein
MTWPSVSLLRKASDTARWTSDCQQGAIHNCMACTEHPSECTQHLALKVTAGAAERCMVRERRSILTGDDW